MEISWELVDHFQRSFGEQAAFDRAREFMFAYVSQLQTPLPTIAARTMDIARKFREGSATLDERNQVQADTWRYVSEQKAWGDSTTGEYCIMRALTVLVRDRLGPGEEHISEVIDWFLFYVDKFENHSENAPVLIRQFFSDEQ